MTEQPEERASFPFLNGLHHGLPDLRQHELRHLHLLQLPVRVLLLDPAWRRVLIGWI